jgi:MFS family permease
VAQLPVGLAMDLYGVRRVQTVLALVAGVGFLLCALSTGIAGLAIGRMIAGLGLSVGMIAMLTAHTQWLPRTQVAGMTGAGVFVASFGGMAATLPAQQLLPFTGWRGLFWILAVLAVLASVWIAASVPDRPPRTGPRPRLREEIGAYRRIVRHWAFLRFAPAIALLSGLNFTYGALWAGPWLRDVGGYEGTVRAAMLMFFAAGMMGGSLLTAQAASYFNRRGHDPMTIPAIAIGGLWLTQCLLIAHPWTNAAAIGTLWFLFAFLSAAGPSAYAALGQRFPAELAGRVGTLINFTMLVTVFVLQNVIGWILDLWPRTVTGGWNAAGYGWAMGLTVVAQAAAVIWALVYRRD